MTPMLDLQARPHQSRVLMGWLASRDGAARRAGVVAADTTATATRWGGVSWDDWVRGNVGPTTAVSESSLRSLAAVTACVNLIAGSIASMPLHTYRRNGDDRESYKSDLWWLLNERPHPAWSAATFWEFMVAARLFHGDAYARILRSPSRGTEAGRVLGFEPVHPGNVEPTMMDGLRGYRVRTAVGGVTRTESLYADDVIHITGPGFDGRRSLSQIQYALRGAGGIALAADSQAATFIGDGVRPDFALEVPGNVSPDQADTLRRTFMERNSGQSSARVPVVLAGGMRLHQLTLSSEDAQLLQTRAFQIEEVCRIFGVPPFMVGHTEKTTSWGSGIEQMSIGFVKYTLQRHLVAIEQEFNNKLFATSRNFCEFVTAGLERGDLKGRYEAYRIGLGRAGEPAWLRPSEIRKLENLPPDPSLDQLPAQAAATGAAP